MSDDTLNILRRAEAEGRANSMSKAEKSRYLRHRRWVRVSTNRWESRDGEQLPFGTAVRHQILKDMGAA